jgi:zinc transporter ZupT
LDVAQAGSQAFGGAALVFLGAIVAYLALTALAAHMDARREQAERGGAIGFRIAMLVAVAIGLHNLGEGLAIGSAYAVGALALGAFLVVGFALHNTTEGLAIVAPVAERPPSLGKLALLGLVAGAPAVVGAWIGASAFNSSIAAFLLGAGAGAIAQVIVQLVPSIRDRTGAALKPATVAGILAGFAILYATSLLVSV